MDSKLTKILFLSPPLTFSEETRPSRHTQIPPGTKKRGRLCCWKPLPAYNDADNPPLWLQGPSPTPQNTHSKTQRPIQRLPSLQPKSPRNSRPRLRPLIRRRDRNKIPTQKSQNRRNTNHGKVPRSIKQGKPPTPRTQPPLVNTIDRPHKKTCININTRRDLATYIHHAVHTHPHHIQRNKIHQTNLHNAGNTSRNSRYATNSNSNNKHHNQKNEPYTTCR